MAHTWWPIICRPAFPHRRHPHRQDKLSEGGGGVPGEEGRVTWRPRPQLDWVHLWAAGGGAAEVLFWASEATCLFNPLSRWSSFPDLLCLILNKDELSLTGEMAQMRIWIIFKSHIIQIFEYPNKVYSSLRQNGVKSAVFLKAHMIFVLVWQFNYFSAKWLNLTPHFLLQFFLSFIFSCALKHVKKGWQKNKKT